MSKKRKHPAAEENAPLKRYLVEKRGRCWTARSPQGFSHGVGTQPETRESWGVKLHQEGGRRLMASAGTRHLTIAPRR